MRLAHTLSLNARSAAGGVDAAPPSLGMAQAMPYRTDIDGLRALAILLVVVYHVWLGRVSGGVDVFLMISAFFLTASFARRMDATSPRLLGEYWSKKFARLLPAAAATLVGVLVTAFLVYPQTMWADLWRQTWASLLYFQNWELAFDEVDYYAREEIIPSPLQHFWSLSVQGQVFILWPLIFLAVAWVVRRTGMKATVLLAAVFGSIFVGSLVFSIIATNEHQSFAYFDSRARLWEFAAGSLVALMLPYFRAPNAVRAVLGWAGLAGIITCGIVLDVRGGFPGYLALWPVLATAAVIFAGSQAASWGPSAMLSSRPLRLLGRDAYALYLVHWPVLITWLIVTDRRTVGPLAGIAIIAVSLVLARLLSVIVEAPTRRRIARPATAMALITVCLVTVAIPLAGWQTAERVRVALAEAQFAADYPGAAALSYEDGSDDDTVVRDDIPLLPDPTTLDAQWVALDSECVGANRPSAAALLGTCVQLDTTVDAVGTVIVVGDSHAQQWMGAVLPIAAEQNWNVVALLKGGCAFAADEVSLGDREECDQWRRAAEKYIVKADPIAVFGMATKTAVDGPERILAGLEQTLESLSTTDSSVILLRDNPRFGHDAFDCVIEFGADAEECSVPRDVVYATVNPAGWLDGGRVHILDLSQYLCPDEVCLPVIGNVAVYLDDNHLTRMYATTLAPMLMRELDDDRIVVRPN